MFGCDKFDNSEKDFTNDFELQLQNTSGFAGDGQSLFKAVCKAKTPIGKNVVAEFSVKGGAILIEQISEFKSDSSFAIFKVHQDSGRYTIDCAVKLNGAILSKMSAVIVIPKALPDSIYQEVNRSKYSIKSDSPIIISSYLIRNIGKVSKGVGIEFMAYQVLSNNVINEVGRYVGLGNNFSDDNGKLGAINLYCDTKQIDTAFPIRIKTSTKKQSGELISNEIVFPYR